MPTYIALLRAVNVGGNKTRMEEVRRVFGKLGCEDVQTYVQSGNVVFKSSRSLTASTLEAGLARAGFPAVIILKTAQEWRRIIQANPLLKNAGDITKLHVTFFAFPAVKDGSSRLDSLKAGKEQFEAAKEVVYLHCPDGYGRSKLNNANIEKAFGVVATTRNWNTVTALEKMASEMGA